jgi:hypothetical protein
VQDLNLRTPKGTDLESVAFGHLANPAFCLCFWFFPGFVIGLANPANLRFVMTRGHWKVSSNLVSVISCFRLKS